MDLYEWSYKKRLQISFDVALSHAIDRRKELKGKDLIALGEEFLEWIVDDYENLQVEWINYWDN